MLEISVEKVARIIVRSRAYEAKTAPWDDDAPDQSEDSTESILEATIGDATKDELTTYIDDLNEDEQATLVALTWIGRGTYEPEDFAEAKKTAFEERVNKTSEYLLGIPLLPDYLEDALEKLGYAVSDLEDDIM